VKAPATQHLSAPAVSIITPIHASMADHFAQTASAVLSQSFSDFEWLIQEDGLVENPLHKSKSLRWIFDDPRVRYESHGEGLGAGAARNIALTRARADLIWVMDADDIPTPFALDLLVKGLHDTKLAWAQGSVDDFTQEGIVVHIPPKPVSGVLAPGELFDYWKAHNTFPMHSAGMLLRKSALERVGAWAGLPVAEDTGMILAVSATDAGLILKDRTMLYRKWSGQTTAASWFPLAKAFCKSAVALACGDPSLATALRNQTSTSSHPDQESITDIAICSVLREEDIPNTPAFLKVLATEPESWNWYIAATSDVIDKALPYLKDPRVHLIPASPIGTRSSAKNLAAAAAVEDILLFADPFDLPSPGFLSSFTAPLSYDDIEYTLSSALDFDTDTDTNTATETPSPLSPLPCVIDKDYFTSIWRASRTWPVLSTWTALSRTIFWRAGGFKAVPRSEDAYLLAQLSHENLGWYIPYPQFTHDPKRLPHATDTSPTLRECINRLDILNMQNRI